MTSQTLPTLLGKRILVVEDEYFIAQDICECLDDCGAEVVGPVARRNQGIALARDTEALDCAVLDLNLVGESAADIMRVLRERHIGFVLLTGYESGGVTEEFEDAPRLTKPFDKAALCHSLSEQMRAD